MKRYMHHHYIEIRESFRTNTFFIMLDFCFSKIKTRLSLRIYMRTEGYFFQNGFCILKLVVYPVIVKNSIFSHIAKRLDLFFHEMCNIILRSNNMHLKSMELLLTPFNFKCII